MAFFIIVVLLLACAWLVYQKWELRVTLKKVAQREERFADIEKAFDYVLRKFSLNVRDPYVVRPGFDEKRCFHCFYPLGHGHDSDCSWVQLQPLVELLYPREDSRPPAPPSQRARPTPPPPRMKRRKKGSQTDDSGA